MPVMQGALDIGVAELGIAALFVVAAGGVSLWNRLQLEKSLLIGSMRCVLQLVVDYQSRTPQINCRRWLFKT